MDAAKFLKSAGVKMDTVKAYPRQRKHYSGSQVSRAPAG